jgi:Mrp family chromosome partitioning ATPase
MEPVGYVHIVKRRWWLLALLAVAAVVLVYVLTPAHLVSRYEATHVLLVESDRDNANTAAANPEVVALWARDSEVLARAADALEPAVNPNRLRRDVSVRAERGVGTVMITATDRDPVRAAEKANAVADATVAFVLEREARDLEQRKSELAAREQSLRQRIDVLNTQISANPPDVETLSAERDALIRQLGDVLDDQDLAVNAVRFTSVDVPERGVEQERFFGTQTRTQRMVLAALVAIVLGFGLAITLDRSDTRLRTRRDAEQRFGLPVIAEIVKFPMWMRGDRNAVVEQPDSPAAESFRTLRSALMLMGVPRKPAGTAGNGGSRGRQLAVILVTSPGAGEGKSTTVTNLAAAYAESGSSVLVLDFDVKRQRWWRRQAGGSALGVSDFLASPTPITLETLIRPTRVKGVRVVQRGSAGKPRGGQLATQRRLLDEARLAADVVIVDAGPLLASGITRELASMVERVIVLCRVGSTSVAEAERCGDLLAQIEAPTVGLVLVGVSAPTSSDYFGYFSLRRHLRARDAGGVQGPGGPSEVLDGDAVANGTVVARTAQNRARAT